MRAKKTNSLTDIYNRLYARYGDLEWWPARSPYEVIIGAVLTQNTAWSNVEKAINNFGEKLSPEFVADIDIKKLSEIIQPAGYYNQKAVYLKTVTEWFGKYDYDVTAVRSEPLDKIRRDLLSVKGVGQETADSILLYAFEFPTFVIDAYTFRLCNRYPLSAGKTYAELKAFFEANLPGDVYIFNNFHALIVINGKNCCKKSKPVCNECPLALFCKEGTRCRSEATYGAG